METFLSKEIYSLVQYFGTETSDTTKYITDDLFINWDLVEAVFCDISDNCIIHEQPEDWFNNKKSSIHDIINAATYRLLNATDVNVSQLWQRCCWTNRTKDIVTCYECLLENEQCRLLEALLVLTSVIERSLGDVYRIHNNNIPFLLRDLLETEYLYSILGKGVIRLMQMLLGTPRFLNIRNLAWHGFLTIDREKYTTLDDIFAPYIDKSNEQINRMYEFLGAAAVELYEDLFSHLAGPRIRDKISHGENNESK
ncbi:hypothetical protein CBL_00122 [Carabus blaptoides fortunei]